MSDQKLPPAKRIEQSCNDGNLYVLCDEGYSVCSWRPGPPNSGPATQVHLLVPLPIDGAKVVVRLKSARAIDELVGVLLEYRQDVFGSVRS